MGNPSDRVPFKPTDVITAKDDKSIEPGMEPATKPLKKQQETVVETRHQQPPPKSTISETRPAPSSARIPERSPVTPSRPTKHVKAVRLNPGLPGGKEPLPLTARKTLLPAEVRNVQ